MLLPALCPIRLDFTGLLPGCGIGIRGTDRVGMDLRAPLSVALPREESENFKGQAQ